MVELIIVIVVIAVLAALAMTGYQKVVKNSQDQAALAELSNVSGASWATGAFRGEDNLSAADMVSAMESSSFTMASGTGSNANHVVAGALAGDQKTWGYAQLSESGSCVYVWGVGSTEQGRSVVDSPTSCSGSFAPTGGGGGIGPASGCLVDLTPEVGAHHTLIGPPVPSTCNVGSTGGNVAGSSSDGRYVLLYAPVDGLAGSNGAFMRVVLSDTQGTVDPFDDTFVFVDAPVGVTPNGDATYPTITPDGRYIGFFANATNIDGDATPGVFRYDRTDGSLQRFSPASGVGAPSSVNSVSITDDGSVMTFSDETGTGWIRTADHTNEMDLGPADRPLISGNGNVVVFSSPTDPLTTCPDAASYAGVTYPSCLYMFNRFGGGPTGFPQLIQLDAAGGTDGTGKIVTGNYPCAGYPAEPNCSGTAPIPNPISGGVGEPLAVSSDGATVLFYSTSSTLDPNNTHNRYQMFVWHATPSAHPGPGHITPLETIANDVPMGMTALSAGLTPDGSRAIISPRWSNMIAGQDTTSSLLSWDWANNTFTRLDTGASNAQCSVSVPRGSGGVFDGYGMFFNGSGRAPSNNDASMVTFSAHCNNLTPLDPYYDNPGVLYASTYVYRAS